MTRSQTPRAEPFHVNTPQNFVTQQPPNQTGNQGPALRGMAPTGPPNQASTPPNTELKVQQLSQPASMNITYVQPSQVRGAQNFYSRAQPPNPTPRMSNHRQAQQAPMYPHQGPPYVPLQSVQPIYMNPVPYYSNTQRTSYPIPMVPSQGFPSYSYPPQSQPQPTTTYYFNHQLQMPRSAPQQVIPTPQTLNQPPPLNLPQATQQQHMQSKHKRRSKAIPIIDPNTGKDKLNELFEQDDSHPPSGESSARQTPQPAPHNPNKEVQATFAKQVAQAINNEESMEDMTDHASHTDHHIESHIYHNAQAVQNSNRLDLAQSSKLQAQTKEFYPTQQNPVKETTPVVSANTDGVEITINNNKGKDRESPVKNRKRDHKEPSKEEKLSSKEDKPKEIITLIEPVPNVKDTSILNQEDKKNVITKKEKIENKPPRSYVTETPEISAPPTSPNLPNTNAQDNAKNKNSNQRKEVSKQQTQVPAVVVPPKQPLQQQQQQQQLQPQQQQQQAPILQQPAVVAPVPQSQPSKPNNKTNKMRDLNLKGASKEGTDMDAFHDSNIANDDVNANVPNTNENNTNNNISDVNKKQESNEVPTIKQPEIKPLSKTKCVTDIVKEVPKPIKNFYPLQDTQDNSNQIVFGNDKKVLAKNEVNAKTSIDNSSDRSSTDAKPSLNYKEGQWSPSNPSGKKVYDLDFLIALRYDEKSKIKPDNIPSDIIAQEDRNRMENINRYPTGGRTNDFAPNFGSNYPGKSSSRGAPVKRNSQQGKLGGGAKGSKSNIIRVSISVKEDVKLHESENAWRPARFNPCDEATEDEKVTNELYKKVRGVLNKLTPQKFDTLLNQVKKLNIDTTERLQGVIDLVFEKAIDEPNFSVAYALLCRELALMQVPANADKSANDSVNFRKLLVTRCQIEFEKNSVDEKDRREKVLEIENCTDPEKKKELQINLEEDDRRLRMKSVGYIRFIGELFKQQMLTVKIMLRCLHKLLDNKDEESLECLCKLLTTIGRELESKNNDLSDIFDAMKSLADKNHCMVSSRIRFMLQDVIDLRNAKWQPRRQDLNPTTMDQIQKEANDEQLSIQVMNSAQNPPRKDERNNQGLIPDRKRSGRNVNNNDDGWSTATTRNRSFQFTVQSDKLKTKPPQVDEPLGSRQMFDTWGKGSNIKTSNLTTTASSPNMYAALETMGNESDKRSLDLRNAGRSSARDPYNSKGPSLERTYKQSHDRRGGSRSGSQHRSADNSQRNTPVQSIPKPQVAPAPVPAPIELTPEKFEQKLKTILEEYTSDCSTVAEFSEELKKNFNASDLDQVVINGYMSVLERSKTARLKCGELFAKLIKMESLPVDAYLKGVEDVLNQADDLIIDIPKLWDYLAEIITPVLAYESITLKVLERPIRVIKEQNHMCKFLGPIFKILVTDKGPRFVQNIWNASSLKLTDLLPAEEIDDFISKNNLGFLLGASVAQQSTISYEEIQEKLLDFFQKKAVFDEIKEWISANVGEKTTEHIFIKILFDAILQNSIHNEKLKADVLESHYKMLQHYVQHNPEYELQCLVALQLRINQLQHPKGLLLQICNKLYEEGIFSQEGFVAWEANDNPAEQTGKGVAVKQLTSFFTQLKEADEETASSASEET